MYISTGGGSGGGVRGQQQVQYTRALSSRARDEMKCARSERSAEHKVITEERQYAYVTAHQEEVPLVMYASNIRALARARSQPSARERSSAPRPETVVLCLEWW